MFDQATQPQKSGSSTSFVPSFERWSRADIRAIYETPLMDLIYRAATVHREHHKAGEVQVCTLLSIKTGGCQENCSYCPQSAHYETSVERQNLLPLEEVVSAARTAKSAGSTRFCMGAAWREVRDNADFDRVIEMVEAVHNEGLEVCATLGMLTESQAKRLEEAGLHAYNHNVDTSPEYYGKIIGTRKLEDRLRTLENVRKTKVTVCSGGIIGMGESHEDRVGMLHTLSNLPTPPESVPVNALVPVEGTPLAEQKRVPVWEMVRMIATARILMPKAKVRLSAGRTEMSTADQALCFLAGANSIFSGEKLLTTPNPGTDADHQMFELLGLTALQPDLNPHAVPGTA
jgi:biotin synthase